MARPKRQKPEQVVNLLRQSERTVANGEDDLGGVKEGTSPRRATVSNNRELNLPISRPRGSIESDDVITIWLP